MGTLTLNNNYKLVNYDSESTTKEFFIKDIKLNT